MDHQIRRIAERVEGLSARSRHPVIVAIDGRSGSGKTTLASSLAKTLDAVVMAGDDFYAGGVEVRPDPPEVLADICIDWRQQRKALISLRETGAAQYFPFDWDAFDGSKKRIAHQIEAKKVMIFEGVYTARPELRDLIDLTVLVEVSHERRLRQLIDREGELSAWDIQWHRAEDIYFDGAAPRDHFDIVATLDER